MQSTSENHQDEIQGHLDAYLQQKAEHARGGVAPKRSLLGKIDTLYWKQTEAVLREKAQADRDTLDFSPEERLWIDMGYIDPRLVEGADDSLRGRLLEELQTPGPAHHFYLTEWLEDRYRRYRLQMEVTETKVRGEDAPPPSTDKNAQARAAILTRLAPLFEGLPGISKDVAGIVAGGGLDDTLLKAGLQGLRTPTRTTLVHRNRLFGLRRQVLQRARARTNDPAVIQLFDALESVYKLDWRTRHAKAAQEAVSLPAHETPEEEAAAKLTARRDAAAAYIVSELRFAKTLMPLGALAGGVARSLSIMTADGPRVTKRETAEGLERASDCDATFDVDPVVLIAPFQGRGIYEWDRDSLVISLCPVESAGDSVANAVGNYRMLIDSFQGEGALRQAYADEFPGSTFHVDFQADYRKWVTGIGCGRADALPDGKRSFFRRWIGPDCDGPLIPGELRHLSPPALRLIRGRLRKQVESAPGDWNAQMRLAGAAYLAGEMETALGHMTLAAKAAPRNGRVLMGLALLLREQGLREKAASIFSIIRARIPDSIWAVYADDALAGQI